MILTIDYLKKYGADYFPTNIKTIKKEILVEMRFREKFLDFLDKTYWLDVWWTYSNNSRLYES